MRVLTHNIIERIRTAESVMCDVIKICLKRKDERNCGKDIPKKEII